MNDNITIAIAGRIKPAKLNKRLAFVLDIDVCAMTLSIAKLDKLIATQLAMYGIDDTKPFYDKKKYLFSFFQDVFEINRNSKTPIYSDP